MLTRPLQTAAPLLGALLLAACGTQGSGPATPPRLAAAQPGALADCTALATKFRFANTQIDSAEVVAAGANIPVPAGEHCLVKGKMNLRKGVDGQDYAIGFEMRLPRAWNGRFYHQVNGGIDGVVQPAMGALGGGPLTGALAKGFAVVSSDAGHTSRQNPRFGEDPIARSDYGYGAVGKVTPMAKALIASAYGRGPDRSYIGGCSNGGRHSMVAASRYGNEYDGYLVGAPGYRLPYAALAQLSAGPMWRDLAMRGVTIPHPFAPNVTLPDLASGFIADEREAVGNAILNRCDALDGAQDGIVQDVQACQAAFNLDRDVPSCTPGRDGRCLTPAQKRVLGAVYAGVKTPSGQSIYSPFPWDNAISSPNWAQWKFVNSLTLDPAAGYIFMTPPRTVTPFQVDVEEALRAITATNATFTESADAVIAAPGYRDPSNLAALRARGAKMILYHGVGDAIFSAEDTRQWMLRLDKGLDGKASDFAKYYPVPGMAHCTAGPATDRFDLLEPLVNWVERGEAPVAVVATARGAGTAGAANPEVPRNWAPNRSRPLCPAPLVARYKGSGSLEEAGNFECR